MLSFFGDEDSMRRGVVQGLRARGIHVLTAAEAGRRRAPDEEQLTFATAQACTLYTSNVGDFARLHRRWLRAGLHHAGIVVLTDQAMPVGAQIRALARLASGLEPEAMQDRLEFLSNWRE